MNIKNYTSSVPVSNSIAKIEHRFAQAGATHIAKSYEGERPFGMIFQIPINGIPMTFKLPAKADKVYNRFINSKKMGYKKAVQETTKKQADMTAWKLLLDLVEIKVSLILLDQVECIEEFLPYAYDGKTDKTLFEKMKLDNFKLLKELPAKQ